MKEPRKGALPLGNPLPKAVCFLRPHPEHTVSHLPVLSPPTLRVLSGSGVLLRLTVTNMHIIFMKCYFDRVCFFKRFSTEY